jgi:hypothetical protein
MPLSQGCCPGKWLRFLVLIVLLGPIGCGGPSTGTVTGKVKYKDTYLKGGTVAFVNEEKKDTKQGGIAEDGTYTIEKIAAGNVKITVETETLRQQSRAPVNAPPPGAGGDFKPASNKDMSKRYVEIPKKYADLGSSGLIFTVKPGKQEHEIKLD